MKEQGKAARVTSEEKLIVKRLKATFADVDEMQQVFDIVTKTLALREAELSVAKVLLKRAADALEEEFGSPNDPAYGIKGPVHELIIELRKAAE
jgi:hypothetical protein